MASKNATGRWRQLPVRLRIRSSVGTAGAAPHHSSSAWRLAVLLFYFQPLFSSARLHSMGRGGRAVQPAEVSLGDAARGQAAVLDAVRIFRRAVPGGSAGGRLVSAELAVLPGWGSRRAPSSGSWRCTALLAAIGGYLLGRDLLRSRAAAVFAGIFFAFSGLFAETQFARRDPFQATAWLPVAVVDGTARGAGAAMAAGAGDVRGMPRADRALSDGAVFVLRAGDFPGGGFRDRSRQRARRAVAALGCGGCGGGAVGGDGAAGAGTDRRNRCAPARITPSDAGRCAGAGRAGDAGQPESLRRARSGPYTGPQDITQFYLYMGILLLPLAAVGPGGGARALVRAGAGGAGRVVRVWSGRRGCTRWSRCCPDSAACARRSRCGSWRRSGWRCWPARAWDGCARGSARRGFALALMADGGAAISTTGTWSAIRWPTRATSFQDLYGSEAGSLPNGGRAADARSDAPHLRGRSRRPAFGPLNGSLDNRMEVTFGYNPLELWRVSRSTWRRRARIRSC